VSFTVGPGTARLIRNGQEVAPLVVADTPAERRRGLLGSTQLDGALWLQPCSSVHCVGMRYPIDVALLDRHGRVLRIRTLRPGRLTLPSPRVRAVVEAPAGAFTHWSIHPGDTLTVEPTPGIQQGTARAS
jgi:uncharacterized membrane protein (UPF0127 family)